jgi:hypothetical protein
MPELEFLMPQWLRDQSPVFSSRGWKDKQFQRMQGGGSVPSIPRVPLKDPLAQFRGR